MRRNIPWVWKRNKTIVANAERYSEGTHGKISKTFNKNFIVSDIVYKCKRYSLIFRPWRLYNIVSNIVILIVQAKIGLRIYGRKSALLQVCLSTYSLQGDSPSSIASRRGKNKHSKIVSGLSRRRNLLFFETYN